MRKNMEDDQDRASALNEPRCRRTSLLAYPTALRHHQSARVWFKQNSTCPGSGLHSNFQAALRQLNLTDRHEAAVMWSTCPTLSCAELVRRRPCPQPPSFAPRV